VSVVAHYYPFGEVVRPLVQQDRSPKRVFVLGVYASAGTTRTGRGRSAGTPDITREVNEMVKILFVCHGNICRSPMAEYVMKKLVKDAGREREFEIASAATSREEIGNPVYAARQMTRADYDRYDWLVGMEPYNIRNMLRITGGDPDGKIRLLMSFAGTDEAIDDPWYTGRFSEVYGQIERGCRAMLAMEGAES